MPKYFERDENNPIHKQVDDDINNFIYDDDVEGLYAYIYENTLEAEKVSAQLWKEGKGGKEERNTPTYHKMMMIHLNLREMYDNEGEDREFLQKLASYAKLKCDIDLTETAKEYENVKELYENGEIKGAELLIGEPKMVDKLARMTTVNNTETGVRYLNRRKVYLDIISDTTGVYQKGETDSKIKHKSHEDSEKSGVFKENELKNAMSVVGEPPLTFVPDSCLNGGFRYSEELISSGNSIFKELPDGLGELATAGIEEIAERRQELESDKKKLEPYETAVADWADTGAKDMLAELNKLPGEFSGIPEMAVLTTALQNAANLGKNITYQELDKDGNPKYDSKKYTSLSYHPNGVKFTLADVGQRISDLKTKIMSMSMNMDYNYDIVFSDVEKNLLRKLSYYKENINKTIEKAQEVYNKDKELDCKKINNLLGRLEIRENQILLKENKPEKMQDLDYFAGQVKEFEDRKDAVNKFKAVATDSQEKIASNARHFHDEKIARNGIFYINAFHGTYNSLTEALDRLADAKIEKKSPAEILEAMKQARDAARAYVDTHKGMKGLKNFFSGWRSAGRERIRHAEDIFNNLDNDIRKIEGNEYEKLGNEDKSSIIGESNEKFKGYMKALRNKISHKKQKYLTEIKEKTVTEGSPEEKKLYKCSEIIARTQRNIREAGAGNKYGFEKELAKIFAVEYLKAEQKKKNDLLIDEDDPEILTSKKEFYKLRKKIQKDKNFRDLVDGHSAQELHDMAQSEGAKDLINALESKKEIKIENKTEIKQDNITTIKHENKSTTKLF